LVEAETLYKNSVVSNEIDFISSSSKTLNHTISFVGRTRAEMPDKRKDYLFDENAFEFEILYQDGTSLEVFAHSEFGTREKAEGYVLKLLDPVGKLPSYMRKKLAHVVIHKGNESAFAEHLGHFFVLYSENMDTRIKNHDLEETVFHESVHATLDYIFSDSKKWLKAQRSDCCFVTEYAESNPFGEDLAETALFAYAYYKYPEQLPEKVKIWLKTKLPNRLKFFEEEIYAEYLR